MEVKKLEMYNGYFIRDLKKAFDKLIEGQKHWKDPICAFITQDTDIGIAMASVRYYTSTNPIIKQSRELGTFIIMAEGYRMGPSGDY